MPTIDRWRDWALEEHGAMRGGDMLIVCGFAFDPQAAEEVKRYGRLTVLPAKMNPDLAMGDELLKKTGAGNLGEPVRVVARDRHGPA